MGLPWQAFGVSSFLLSCGLIFTPTVTWNIGLAGTFAAAWSLQFLAWVVWRVILWPKLFSPLRRLPEPPNGSFFMGQHHRIRKEPTGSPQREWIKMKNPGLIRYLAFFNQERVVPTSPQALSEILVTRSYDFERPAAARHFLSKLLGNSLLVAENDVHKVQRRNLMPAFAFRHVKNLYPLFWQKARESLEGMAEHIKTINDSNQQSSEKGLSADEGNLEILSWASRTTLDIIGVAALGRDFGAVRDPDNELNQVYRQAFHPPSGPNAILMVLREMFPSWLITRLPFKRNDEIDSAVNHIRSMYRELVQEKKAKLARKEMSDPDISSVAVESGLFTDEELVDQLMTFLAAGHETTASALMWAIYLLSKRPDVQERLRQEIRENLPSPDSSVDVSNSEIDRLPYLRAVTSEVLRYFPPVAISGRVAVVDTVIVGQPIPKGTRIIFSPWANNHDQEFWGPDAGEFNPDRWMLKKEDGQNGQADAKSASRGGCTSNYGFMTFLHGPRSCIGTSFAQGEFACILAMWIGRFNFELADKSLEDESKLDISSGITQQLRRGLKVRATSLDGW